jgi:aminopeptidase N
MLRAITIVLCLVASFATPASSTVTDHSVEVTLFPDSGEIMILDQVRVTGRDHYRFGLAAWLEIESLLLDGREASAEMHGQSWHLSLPDRKPHELVFTLRGAIPLRGVSQNPASAMRSSAGSEGVYLPGYDDWIANDADAATTYRVTVSVPPGQLAVVTGKLLGEQSTDAGYRATFEAESPGEPPSLFAGPYRMGERQSHGLRLRSYFHADIAGLSDAYLDAADAYIQRYQQSIGAYPYSDFSMISAPIPVGLGFPGVTYAGREIMPLPFMRTRSLAHEVLHNWWGNGIGVDYDSGNWAEGLTTYLADYAIQRDQGDAAARTMRVKWLRDYAALPNERDQPVSAFKSKRHQASQVIGYNKVAFIFHMLSREIGQPAFDDGLRGFWSRHKYKTAGWRDLQLAFEQTVGAVPRVWTRWGNLGFRLPLQLFEHLDLLELDVHLLTSV